MIDLEKLLKEKYELEVLIQDKVNEFQEKYDTELNVLVYDDGVRITGKDYHAKKASLKVQL